MRVQRRARDCRLGDRMVYLAPVEALTDEPVEEVVTLTEVHTAKGRTRLEFGRRSVTRYPDQEVTVETA